MQKILFILSFVLFLNAYGNQEHLASIDENKTINATKSLSDAEKAEKIKQFYAEKLKVNFPEIKIHFIEKTKLNDLEAFVFEFEMGKEKNKEMIFVKDNLFFADGARLDILESLRDEAQTLFSKEKFKNILENLKEDKKYIVTLGSGSKNIFVFSDPECPYCKKHLQKLDETYLKKYKVHFIFYTIRDNFKIIAGIYNDLKDKQSDEEKLKIIKHYFFENPNYNNVSEEQIQKARNLFEKYKNLGVLYTPFEIEE